MTQNRFLLFFIMIFEYKADYNIWDISSLNYLNGMILKGLIINLYEQNDVYCIICWFQLVVFIDIAIIDKTTHIEDFCNQKIANALLLVSSCWIIWGSNVSVCQTSSPFVPSPPVDPIFFFLV